MGDKAERKDNGLSSNHFHSNREGNESLLSEWHAFTQQRSRVTKTSTIIYRTSQIDGASCPLKTKCLLPNTPNRKIIRSIYEAACYVARRIADQVSLPDG